MDQSRKRLVIVAIAAFIVLVTIIVIATIVSLPKEVKTGIRFVIVPDKVTVKTGDRSFSVTDEKQIAFEPGSYTLTFSSDHFSDSEKKVTVKEGELTPVYVLLKASDDTGAAILKEDKYRSRIERIAGFEVNAGAIELTNKYPFIDKLPITGKYYYIYPCVVNTETKEYGACVKLALQGDFYKNQALDALRNIDIDPDTITVQFQ